MYENVIQRFKMFFYNVIFEVYLNDEIISGEEHKVSRIMLA